MNKKNAIKILEVQKSKLENNSIYKDETWVFQTASYIKDFFGENSTEYSFISQFNFMVKVLNTTSNDETLRLLNEKKEKVATFIDNCIETIRNKGILKEEKVNFLNRLGNGPLVAIIVFIVPSLIGLGFYFGTEKINQDNIVLKEINKKTIASFDSLTSIIENNQGVIDSLLLIQGSIDSTLLTKNSIIDNYNNSHLNISISFSKPLSIFNGLVLINAEKYFDNAKVSFEGIKAVGSESYLDLEKKKTEMKKGDRLFLVDMNNQKWIINVMDINYSQIDLELIKKTMP